MRRGATLVAFVLLAALPAGATSAMAASSSVYLEDLTWTELRDRVAAGTTTIIIPIGGTEQSGPAMSLGKHNVRVKILAGQIATALGNAIVAPVVAYVPEGNISPPTEHMAFPGTISVSDSSFEAVLDSAAQSLHHAGFTTIVLIGDHGGYQQDEQIVADKLNATWKGTRAAVFADLDYYRITQTGYVDKLLQAGIGKDEIGSHAGLADTSLMLATDPSQVRADLLPTSKFTAKDGVYGGDSRRSSAVLGQMGVDLIVQTTVADIRAFIAKQQG
jgi:creatinine amidohydrolase